MLQKHYKKCTRFLPENQEKEGLVSLYFTIPRKTRKCDRDALNPFEGDSKNRHLTASPGGIIDEAGKVDLIVVDVWPSCLSL